MGIFAKKRIYFEKISSIKTIKNLIFTAYFSGSHTATAHRTEEEEKRLDAATTKMNILAKKSEITVLVLKKAFEKILTEIRTSPSIAKLYGLQLNFLAMKPRAKKVMIAFKST